MNAMDRRGCYDRAVRAWAVRAKLKDGRVVSEGEGNNHCRESKQHYNAD
jgi:hypothetical protein